MRLTNLIHVRSPGIRTTGPKPKAWVLSGLLLIFSSTMVWAVDSDNDGLDDAWETTHFGNLDYDGFDDPDGDRVPNIFEAQRSTDPTDGIFPGADRTVDILGSGTDTSIQEAIYAASDYDIIRVKPGVYPESVGVFRKVLIVADHAANVPMPVIEAQYGTTVTLQDGAVLDGFVVRHAASAEGQGLEVNNYGAAMAVNCFITENRDFTAVRATWGSLYLVHCVIAGNTPTSDVGLVDAAYDGDIYLLNSVVWNPNDGDLPELSVGNAGEIHVTHSIVRGGLMGGVDEDPLLTRDGFLQGGSPGLGAGAALAKAKKDMHGTIRSSTPDLGLAEMGALAANDVPGWWKTAWSQTDAVSDPDSDGLNNLEEYIFALDPNDPDCDGDGLTDGDEVELYQTYPWSPDSDGDKMPDPYEVANGLDATAPDALEDLDHDRYPNIFEYRHKTKVNLAGLDPDPLNDLADPAPPVYTVDSNGLEDFSTIAEAVDTIQSWNQNQPYAIIKVNPGHYVESYLSLGGEIPVLVLGEPAAGRIPVISTESFGSSSERDTVEVRDNAVLDGFYITHEEEFMGPGVTGGGQTKASAPRVRNCIISRNFSAENQAGGAAMSEGAAIFESCTFLNNRGSEFSSASGFNSTFINCILWSNSPAPLPEMPEGGFPPVNCVIREALNGAEGTDPLLTPKGWLSKLSPARGTGLETSLYDINGESRSGGSDIGADQFADADNDGMPDWFEALGGISDAGADPDGDELDNLAEYLHGSDPTLADTDGDGVEDGAEVSTHGTNPLLADTDGDEMPDGYEITNGLDPAGNDAFDDFDEDRVPNIFEYRHGTKVTVSGMDPDPNNVVADPPPVYIVDVAETGDYTTINEAIFGLFQEDQKYGIIRIKPGTYLENVWSGGERTMLLLADSNSPAGLVRISGFDGATVEVSGTVVLNGLIITHQPGYGGYGIRFSADTGGGEGSVDSVYNLRLVNCLIIGNRPENYWEGGGLIAYGNGDFIDLIHTTIFDNSSYDEYGQNGIADGYGITLRMENSVVWNDSGLGQDDLGTGFEENKVLIAHSIVRRGPSYLDGYQPYLEDVLALDPLLTASGFLTSVSPAVNAGTDAGVEKDIQNETRDSQPDLGMDELAGDSDSDGLSDNWEISYFGNLGQTGEGDPDGDDLTNLQESLFLTDPTLADSDGDLLEDGAEVDVHGTNPLLADTDNDGMNDYYETSQGLDPLSSQDALVDSDGDRYPNLVEALHGSASDNAGSLPAPDLVVDAGGTGDYLSLQEAFDEIRVFGGDYDIILVKPGEYSLALVTERKVVIVSEGDAVSTVITTSTRVLSDLIMDGFSYVGGSGFFQYGGAMNIESDARVILKNSIFRNAKVTQSGGAFYLSSGNLTLENCTVINNQAGEGANGIDGSGTLTVRNSILWNPGELPEVGPALDGSITYSCIRGNWDGAGNLDSNPLVRPDGRLRADSPARDAGASTLVRIVDIDGEPRPSGSGVDLGADEFVSNDGDGLADAWELVVFGDLDEIDSGDEEPDSLNHLAEYQNGTDPLVADTDGDGWTDSEEVLTYLTNPLEREKVGDITFSSPSGIYTETVELVLATPDHPDAVIHYTLNGSEPSESSPVYSAPLELQSFVKVKAKGYKLNFVPTEVGTEQYTVDSTAVFAKNGMYAWFKGGLGAVVQPENKVSLWTDLTANGHHAVQSSNEARPLLVQSGGKGSLVFNGGQVISLPTPARDSFTIIVRFSSDRSSDETTFWQQGMGVASSFFSSSYSLGYGIGVSGQGKALGGVVDHSNAANLVSTTGYDEDVAQTVMLRRDKTTGLVELFLDRDLVDSGTGPTTTLYPTGSISLGRIQQGAWLNGTIHEVMVYDRAVTEGERIVLADYFKANYGETVSPPRASVLPGAYLGAQTVALTSSTNGAEIRYTVDGSTPDLSSPLYSAPIVFSDSGATVLKARAFRGSDQPSAIFTGQYTIDDGAPQFTQLKFGAEDLVNGLEISGAGTVRISGSDLSGIRRVEIYVDGQLVGTATISSSGVFEIPWNLSSVLADGAHVLTVKIYDIFEQVTSQNTNVVIALAPPAAPVFTSPVNALQTAKGTVILKGTAPANSKVSIYRTGVSAPLFSGIGLAPDNTFQVLVTLEQGTNSFEAEAFFRAGHPGARSAARIVIRDNDLPAPPTGLKATALAAGAVKLDWTIPGGGRGLNYRVYRAPAPFSAQQSGVQVANSIEGSTYSDFPPSDQIWYYRVSSVKPAGTESEKSESIAVASDRVAPTAKLQYLAQGPFDSARGHYGLGDIKITLTLLEPIQGIPFLSFAPDTVGASPLAVNLAKAPSDAEGHPVFTATLKHLPALLSGVYDARVAVRDVPGNLGAAVQEGAQLYLDNKGPKVTEVNFSGAIQNNAATPVTVSFLAKLDEVAYQNGGTAIPVFKYRLSQSATSWTNVTTSGGTVTPGTNNLEWQVSLPLSASAGSTVESLQFALEAEDSLGNGNASFATTSSFEVYQGDLPPLAVPAGLTAKSKPAGAVDLTWQAVPGAGDYQVYRGTQPNGSDLEALTLTGNLTSWTDTPVEDDTYYYAVESVRQENSQVAYSGVPVDLTPAVSDRTPPAAPETFEVSLSPRGAQLTWAASGDAYRYEIYRAATAISDLTGLTPLKEDIAANQTQDEHPLVAFKYYAVAAVDSAGNRSGPSAPGYFNASLLPVPSLQILKFNDAYPVLSWTAASGTVSGYNVYSVEGETLRKLNDGLAAGLSFADTAFSPPSRQYSVTTVDGQGVESLGRPLDLPDVDFAAEGAQTLTKNCFNRWNFRAINRSATEYADARFTVLVAGVLHSSAPFLLPANAEATGSVMLPGYSTLVAGGQTDTVTALELRPHSTEKVRLERSGKAPVQSANLQVELQASDFVTGGSGKVQFVIKNSGGESLDLISAEQNGLGNSPDLSFDLVGSDRTFYGNTPVKITSGGNVLLAADGQSHLIRIPAGATYTSPEIEIPVPDNAPRELYVVFKVARLFHNAKAPDESVLPAALTVRQGVNAVRTSYYSRVTETTVNPDDTVLIEGFAKYRDSDSPAPLVPVVVSISAEGFERVQEVYTDDNGLFSYVFQPSPDETGGIYSTWAMHPDLNDKKPQAQFTISRLLATPSPLKISLPRNYPLEAPFRIATAQGTSVENVRLEYHEEDQAGGVTPTGLTVQTPQSIPVLGSRQVGSLGAVIGADGSAAPAGTITLRLMANPVSGSDKLWQKVEIQYNLINSFPDIRPSRTFVDTGVAPGDVITERLTLKNVGYSSLEGAKIRLLDEQGRTAPAWAQIPEAAAFTQLAAGRSSEISLQFAPPEGTALGDYVFRLRVEGIGFPGQELGVHVAVTNSGTSVFQAQVVDAFSIKEEGVFTTGVRKGWVTLTNDEVRSIEFTKEVPFDEGGIVVFNEANVGRTIPPGVYTVRASAEGRDTVTRRVWLRPGAVTSEFFALPFNPVEISWSVVETTITDRYDILLDVKFQADVPVPVVVAEPSAINMPEMEAGETIRGEIIFTNYGLIPADNLKATRLKQDANYIFEFQGDLPSTLGPRESVVLPYKITCVQPPDGALTGSLGEEDISKAFATWSRPADTSRDLMAGDAQRFLVKGEREFNRKGREDREGERTAGRKLQPFHVGEALRFPATPDAAAALNKTLVNARKKGASGMLSLATSLDASLMKALTSTPISGGGCYLGSVDYSYSAECPNGTLFASGGSVGYLFNAGHCDLVLGDMGNLGDVRWWGWGGFVDVWWGGSMGPQCFPKKRNPGNCGGGSSGGSGGGGAGDDGGCKNEEECEKCEKDDEDDDDGGGGGGGGDGGGGGGSSCNGSNSGARESSNSWVDLINREYQDDGADMRVRVAGGRATILRMFYEDRWHFAFQKQLGFIQAADGSGVVTITRNSVEYNARDVARTLFELKGTTIRKTPTGYRWSQKAGNWEDYDLQGRLLAWGTRDKTIIQLIRGEGSSVVTGMADRYGNTIYTFEYLEGKLSKVTDLAGRTVEYTWSGQNLTQVKNTMGGLKKYQYDGDGRMTRKEDPSGKVIRIEYQAGYVSAVLGGPKGDQHFFFNYDASKREYYAQIKTGGQTEEKWYDVNATPIKRAHNGKSELEISTGRRDETRTDVIGRVTRREFDERENVTLLVGPDGSRKTYKWDSKWNNLLERVDARGMVTKFSYNANGHMIQKTEAFGTSLARTWNWEYDNNDRMILGTDPLGHRTAYEYDSRDLITKTYDPNNTVHQTLFEYDFQGNRIKVTDALGGETRYEYDERGRLEKIINALDEETVNTYEGNQLIRVENGKKGSFSGRITEYEYDAEGRQTEVYRLAGSQRYLQTSQTYGSDGHVVATQDAVGNTSRYQYDEAGRQIKILATGFEGVSSLQETRYDEADRVIETIDSFGTRVRREYDDQDRVIRITEAFESADERITEMVYDQNGNVIQTIYLGAGPENQSYVAISFYDILNRHVGTSGDRQSTGTWIFDANDNVISVTDARGYTTTRDYDAYGKLIKTTLPSIAGEPASISEVRYDEAGNTLWKKNANGIYFAESYDALNRPIMHSLPLTSAPQRNWHSNSNQISQSIEYNQHGEIEVVNVRGYGERTMQYDSFGRKISFTTETGQTVNITYSSLDKVVSVIYGAVEGTIGGASSSMVYEYDSTGQFLKSVTDRAGLHTVMAYDILGRQNYGVTPAGVVQEFAYDSLGRMISQSDSLNETNFMKYDRFDQIIEIKQSDHTQENPRIEKRNYDNFGRLVAYQGVGQYPMTFSYDSAGNRLSIKDGNNSVTSWEYNARNLVSAKEFSDGSRYTYRYDADGNLTLKVDSKNQATNYSYNAFQQLQNIDHSSDADVEFGYDNLGRRTSMSDGTGITSWNYDAIGRLASTTQGGLNKTINYGYDSESRKTSLSFDNRTITYGYDSVGRLRSLSDSAVEGGAPFIYSYGAGPNWVTQVENPMGAGIFKERNLKGQVISTAYTLPGGAVMAQVGYSFNKAGQPTSETGLRGSVNFSYDDKRQLTSASGISDDLGTLKNYQYNYDVVGNRLSADEDGDSVNYSKNSLNQYTSISQGGGSTVSPQYDLNGNMIASGANTYHYDQEDRLTEFESAIANSQFTYDGLGRRVCTIETAVDVQSTWYLYDGFTPIAELNGAGEVTRHITRGLDLSGSIGGSGGVGGLLATTVDDETGYYFSDGGGNVVRIFDRLGSVLATYTYDPYGKKIHESGSWKDQPYQWSSKEYHQNSGMVYFLCRFYDPVNGRWINRDPLGERGGINLYNYVNNRVNSRIDPYGLADAPIPVGDFDFFASAMSSDSVGAQILYWYIVGQGDERRISEDKMFVPYLKSNSILSKKVKEQMVEHAKGVTKENNTGKIDLTFQGEVAITSHHNMTGYHLLHGTRAQGGDETVIEKPWKFNVVGTYVVEKWNENGTACKVNYDVKFQWNDRIVLNRKYTTDFLLNVMLDKYLADNKKALESYKPGKYPFVLRIDWGGKPTYDCIKDTGTEWPFQLGNFPDTVKGGNVGDLLKPFFPAEVLKQLDTNPALTR